MTNEEQHYPIVTVRWREAAYTFQDDFPDNIPSVTVTIGYLIHSDDHTVAVAWSFQEFEEDASLYPKEGAVIPRETVISVEKR